MVDNIDISSNNNYGESINKMKEAVAPVHSEAKGIDQSKDFGENSGVKISRRRHANSACRACNCINLSTIRTVRSKHPVG